MKNEIRSELQKEVVDLSKDYDDIIIEWATGVGKTLAALKVIDQDNKQWTILCKETNHIENWKKDINKHKMSYLLNRISFYCYQSLHKIKDIKSNLILDECHGALSDRRREFINMIDSDKRLYLSATIVDDKKDLLKELFKGEVVHHQITTDEAIEYGILPSPEIIVVDCYLDNTVRNLTYKKTKGKKEKRKKFTCKFDNRFHKLKQLKNEKHYILNIPYKCAA